MHNSTSSLWMYLPQEEQRYQYQQLSNLKMDVAIFKHESQNLVIHSPPMHKIQSSFLACKKNLSTEDNILVEQEGIEHIVQKHCS
jgi:hypothetical protein